MDVYAIFDPEIYEVFNENHDLIDQAVNYEQLLDLCKEQGYNLIFIWGLEDDLG